jgi:hypothetical protein
MYDRHRRLGRNSARRAEQVTIEHHVARNDDVCPGKIGNPNGHGCNLADHDTWIMH